MTCNASIPVDCAISNHGTVEDSHGHSLHDVHKGRDHQSHGWDRPIHHDAFVEAVETQTTGRQGHSSGLAGHRARGHTSPYYREVGSGRVALAPIVQVACLESAGSVADWVAGAAVEESVAEVVLRFVEVAAVVVPVVGVLHLVVAAVLVAEEVLPVAVAVLAVEVLHLGVAVPVAAVGRLGAGRVVVAEPERWPKPRWRSELPERAATSEAERKPLEQQNDTKN